MMPYNTLNCCVLGISSTPGILKENTTFQIRDPVSETLCSFVCFGLTGTNFRNVMFFVLFGIPGSSHLNVVFLPVFKVSNVRPGQRTQQSPELGS
jgi:hypothetical protein